MLQTGNKIFLILYGILIIFSCKPSEIPDNEGDCIEIVSDSPFGFYIQKYPPYIFLAPCFNPNNGNEFIYIRQNITTSERELYKFDIINDTSLLIKGNVTGYPKWGKKDWILIELNDQNIWKIKSNGDSLTLLSSEGIYSDDAVWNQSGTKFIFRLHYGDSVNSVICNLDGSIETQTSDIIYEGGVWASSSDKILYATSLAEDYGIAWMDTNLTESHKFKLMASKNGWDILMGMAWMADNENVLWSTGSTVSITNIYSGSTSELLKNCDSKKYQFPSVSPDGTKILFEKEFTTEVSEVELFIEYKIVIINVDGSQETILLE